MTAGVKAEKDAGASARIPSRLSFPPGYTADHRFVAVPAAPMTESIFGYRSLALVIGLVEKRKFDFG
jgi:hypothetical protein